MRGFTLVEMLVVLALLGVFVSVSTVSLMTVNTKRQATELEQARIEAIRSGTPRTSQGVLFLPDGRAIGPGFDPLTGGARAQ